MRTRDSKHPGTPRRATTSVVAAVAVLGVVVMPGCGDERVARVNDERPALNASLSVAIGEGEVQLSPVKVGAGAVELLIANRSNRSQTVTLKSKDGAVAVRTTPISPRETSRVAAVVEEGAYSLRTGHGGGTAKLTVGPPRGGSQGELLIP